MIMLAMVLDEMKLDERNTVIVTGIGCTGRMGGYLKHEAVYTLHGRTLPVAEAIKTVRPEMNVIVVAGDGDTASIGGNHLIHTIRRNAPVTVLCNNNEIYGLTGGQTGPTTPTGTKTLSSPGGNPNTPINLQGLVRSSPHALYAKSTVYHQMHLRNVIREAIEWDGFSFVDITSQCIENNGRRIGFASANDMLTFYRKTYKRAPQNADHLEPFQIGIVYPAQHAGRNGNGTHPAALPDQPAGPMTSATESPGEGGATTVEAATPTVEPRTDDEKAQRRAESQERARVMGQLSADVKLQVARKEISLADALSAAGLDVPEWARTGASAPSGAPVTAGDVEISATGADPRSDAKSELDAQKAEAKAESRNLVGRTPGSDTLPVAPITPDDAHPPAVADRAAPARSPIAEGDSKEAKRREAQRKLAIMQRLPSELKLRVAKREISLDDAMREAGIRSDEHDA
jgi:2-oxoglutarate ferredoxin oxidoreductase subunit beta